MYNKETVLAIYYFLIINSVILNNKIKFNILKNILNKDWDIIVA